MSNSLNWGILGTSFISGVMADAILEEGQTQLYSVAGRSEETLLEFAKKYQIEQIYTDYDALINDEKVDIIYIALPNHLHHEFIIKAANAGKAILCEKSLSIDMQKTELALAAVEKNNVFFVEGLMYLTHPLTSAISDLIRSKSIGDIRSIHAQYCAPIAEFVNPQSKGALYNLGCYPMSLVHLVLQQAYGDSIFDNYQVSATGVRGEDGNICESAARFQFSNPETMKQITTQLYTAENYGLHSNFTILGNQGSIEVISNPWLPERNNIIHLTQYEQPSEIIKVTAEGNGFLYQVKQIRNALEANKTSLQRPSAMPKDSYQIMKLLTDWEASHNKN